MTNVSNKANCFWPAGTSPARPRFACRCNTLVIQIVAVRCLDVTLVLLTLASCQLFRSAEERRVMMDWLGLPLELRTALTPERGRYADDTRRSCYGRSEMRAPCGALAGVILSREDASARCTCYNVLDAVLCTRVAIEKVWLWRKAKSTTRISQYSRRLFA